MLTVLLKAKSDKTDREKLMNENKKLLEAQSKKGEEDKKMEEIK